MNLSGIFLFFQVPVWSAVSLMGVKLKDINKDIGSKIDPEKWNDIHDKIINSENELIEKKGYSCWGIGICVGEIVDAVVRNTSVCMTVSTYIKVLNIQSKIHHKIEIKNKGIHVV